MCILTAQARTKCGPRSRDPFGARHFPENSRINVSYDLEEVLARRSCGDPDEIRCNPLRGHDPVQVLVKRSCVLFRGSLHDLVQVLEKIW